MSIDQCKNCQLRGDLDSCLSNSCSVHDSWFVNALLERNRKV